MSNQLLSLILVVITNLAAFVLIVRLQSIKRFNRLAEYRPYPWLIGFMRFLAMSLLASRMAVQMIPLLTKFDVLPRQLDESLINFTIPGLYPFCFLATLFLLCQEGVRIRLGVDDQDRFTPEERRQSALLIGLGIASFILVFVGFQLFVFTQAVWYQPLLGPPQPVFEKSGVAWLLAAVTLLLPVATMLLIARLSRLMTRSRQSKEKTSIKAAGGVFLAAFYALLNVPVTRAIVIVSLCRTFASVFRWLFRIVPSDADPNAHPRDSLRVFTCLTNRSPLGRLNAAFLCAQFFPMVFLLSLTTTPFTLDSIYPQGHLILWSASLAVLAFPLIEHLASSRNRAFRWLYIPLNILFFYGPFVLFPSWWKPASDTGGLRLLEMNGTDIFVTRYRKLI